jgi:23S rRNA pseudouridine1911/1915/1917 synthase
MHSTKSNLRVLYEDNHLIVINKRIGDIVQGDITGDKPLSEVVKEYIAEKYDKPGKTFLGVVHRLDRPTTGIVVFAKTSKALERLNKMLRDKSIEKIYWALVEGHPESDSGTLVHYLRKNPKNNKATAFTKESADTKKAVLHYRKLLSLDHYTLLEINLETGRHHQIRCQLSVTGYPIKGDLKYGSKRSNKDGGIHLHATRIKFVHPVKKEEITIEAPLPNEVLWQLCSGIVQSKSGS